MDIGLTRSMDFKLDDTNDLPVVTGRAALEQAIAVATMEYFHEDIGDVDMENAPERLERRARDVVDATQYADEVQNIEAIRSAEEPNTIEMRIIYGSNEVSELPPIQ